MKTAIDYGFEAYSSFKPTSFDSHINVDHMCDDDDSREHWAVMPVSRHRDSQPIDNVNFDSFVDELGGESDDIEVHRFGHWGHGWFEILLVNPANELIMAKAYDLARALADYPILDEEALSSAEFDEAMETFDNCYRRDIEASLENEIDCWDSAPILDLWLADNSPDYEFGNDGAHFDIDDITQRATEFAGTMDNPYSILNDFDNWFALASWQYA